MNNNEITKNNTSTETVTISRAEYEKLLREKAKLEHQLDYLMEQLRLSKQKMFGKSSEKMKAEAESILISLFDEPEVMSSPITEETTESGVEVKSHTRSRKSNNLPDNLPEDTPVEVVEHKLSEAELICHQCGTEMQVIGKEVRRSLMIVPQQLKIREDVYYTYACKNCEQNATSTPVIKTPKDCSVIPGSFASPESIAYLMTQKFVMACPIYRIEQNFKRSGIDLSRQTMSNWMLKATELWLNPIYEQLRQQLVQREVLHADETPLQVLNEPGKTPESKSYMWLYRTSGDTDQPVVLYQYAAGRGREYPERFLAGFKGYLHSDGYTCYHCLNSDIVGVGCWAHLRRKFDEALKAQPKGKSAAATAAMTGVGYCTRISKIEKKLENCTPEERYIRRQKQVKPLLDELFAWGKTVNAAPKSALGRALTYMENQWEYLCNILKDGRLEFTNNRAERSIKPFVIARKNFLFAVSQKGAQSSATMFSLIETAKENKLDPYRYLCYIFKTAPTLDQSKPDWITPLLPANAPDECRTGKRK